MVTERGVRQLAEIEALLRTIQSMRLATAGILGELEREAMPYAETLFTRYREDRGKYSSVAAAFKHS